MKSIRGRLLSALLAGITAVILAGGAALYWIVREGWQQQLDSALEARARAVASLVTLDDGRFDFEFQSASDPALHELYFELRTMEGRLLRRSPNLAESSMTIEPGRDRVPAFADLELPQEVRARAVAFAFVPRVDADVDVALGRPAPSPIRAHVSINGSGGRARFTNVPRPREPVASPARETDLDQPLVIAAAIDRRPMDRALLELLGGVIGVGSIVAFAAVALVIAGVRWGLRPIAHLSGQLGAIDGPTIGRRLHANGSPRELMPIYRELNGMLDRLERTVERERAFASAAAHELRTPLTELRTMIEVAMRWPDPERSCACLGEILAIGREMERLVESLLHLSRVNFVDQHQAPAPVAAIVRQCLQEEQRKIAQKRLRVDVRIDSNATLRASAEAIEIMMRNLIGNAVEYTPSGGAMTIRAEPRGGGSSALLVENGPVELSEADLPHLFEPFWRTDRARTDRTHAGLGLTVVQRIAHAADLRVDARLDDRRLQIEIAEGSNDAPQNETAFSAAEASPAIA